MINHAWVMILIAAINSTIGNILLKKSQINTIPRDFIGSLFTPNFILGIFFYGINVLLFAKALRILPVSTAYPALSILSFIFLSLFSFFFLGERFTQLQILGLGLILSGLLFLAL